MPDRGPYDGLTPVEKSIIDKMVDECMEQIEKAKVAKNAFNQHFRNKDDA